ncbi:hypothetical protein AB0A69_06520 [Streptomyces sp. NPDC045431]|uniref:hypothetical protein n=1 Tax=Streptomyces sp. NPDC045431 TaxID=3155613 RepID=UPI0033D1F8CB
METQVARAAPPGALTTGSTAPGRPGHAVGRVDVDLKDYGFSDRLTSYKNNQTSGTRALFYNWQGSWVYKFDSHAYHTEDSLANTSWNNLIDGVRVC